MLILTRRQNETIRIGEHITVTVLGVQGNRVRLGINAPDTVLVAREELQHELKRLSDGRGSNCTPTPRADE